MYADHNVQIHLHHNGGKQYGKPRDWSRLKGAKENNNQIKCMNLILDLKKKNLVTISKIQLNLECSRYSWELLHFLGEIMIL